MGERSLLAHCGRVPVPDTHSVSPAPASYQQEKLGYRVSWEVQEDEDCSTLVNSYLVSRGLEASPREPCFQPGAIGMY